MQHGCAGRVELSRRGRTARFSTRLESLVNPRMARQDPGDARGDVAADLDLGSWSVNVWRGRGAGVWVASFRGVVDRPCAAHSLVQSLRPAESVARNDAAS